MTYRRLCRAQSLLMLPPLLAACGPASTLDPAGPGAARIAETWWAMLIGATVILVAVTALALYATLRHPDRKAPVSPRTLLIGGGLVLPLAGTFALLVYGIRAGEALLPLPTEREVFRVEVRGHQWWWEVRYPDVDGEPVYGANELHIPAGRPVDVHVLSADVIHSFWVPRLGGKLDMIPGQRNVLRLEADRPGVYRGQCAEFCGAQHARMAFVAIAHPPEALEARLRRLALARLEGEPEAFEQHCAACHATDARQRSPVGPNLAGVAGRMTLGAGTVENVPGALHVWLRGHQSLKPGNRMPPHDHLDDETLAEIAGWLGGDP
jgi:cytochrome c oxidase subunit II